MRCEDVTSLEIVEPGAVMDMPTTLYALQYLHLRSA